MSYPDPRYLGDTGEATATFRSADQDPDLLVGQTRAHYLATGGSTDGLFGLYRWDMAGTPGGAGAHFHRSFTESFFVISGSVRLYDGRTWVDGAPGDFVHVPVGGLHGFRNESGEPASMLILFTPGAPREAYFEGLARMVTGEWTPSEDELNAFFVEHDNYYV